MEEPMFSTCCESLVGCRTCVEQWLLTADHCLKCRAQEFDSKVHQVKGLSAFLSSFKEIQSNSCNIVSARMASMLLESYRGCKVCILANTTAVDFINLFSQRKMNLLIKSSVVVLCWNDNLQLSRNMSNHLWFAFFIITSVWYVVIMFNPVWCFIKHFGMEQLFLMAIDLLKEQFIKEVVKTD